MNFHTLVAGTEQKIRFLECTDHVINDERRQRIRTAEVQSAIFVKRLLARLTKGGARFHQAGSRNREFASVARSAAPLPAGRAPERVRECTWTANTLG
jgi:hypothetical protein